MSHLPRRVLLLLAALTLCLPACGKSKDDDDKPAASPPPAAQPPAPATVAADPDPTPPPTGQPATPTPAGTAHPAGTSSGTKPKSQPSANNNSPIPSALVPKPLQPLVPKIPANVLP